MYLSGVWLQALFAHQEQDLPSAPEPEVQLTLF
jgi:hypothetical protein